MSDGWRPTHDRKLILRLHHLRNPGLFELAYQYSHLGAGDLPRGRYRLFVHTKSGSIDGMAILGIGRSTSVALELWCNMTGRADWEVRDWNPNDSSLMDVTMEFLRRSCAVRTRRILRCPPDNPFARSIAIREGLQLEATLLLSARQPAQIRRPSLSLGYSVRPYVRSDAEAYARIHNGAFAAKLSPDEMRAWATARRSRSFTATYRGEPVGLIIGDVRRCGRIADFNLALDESHRHQGLGTALLAQVMRVFLSSGVKQVVADHWAFNGPAVSFWSKHGFRLVRSYDFFRM